MTSNPSLQRLKKFSLYALIAAVVIVAWGIYSRMQARAALVQTAQLAATPVVQVTTAKHSNVVDELVLPGNVQAYNDAPIYARTSGYLKRWYVDIGQTVKAGALMAEIETPEADAQLRQAQADLATAHANNILSQSTAARYQSLVKSGTVSKQDAEEKQGDADAKKAAEDSAHENMERLLQIKSFAKVTAPFTGVVTARRINIGALVNAGNASGQELFHLSSIGKLRIYVQVPQAYVNAIKVGETAELNIVEQPAHHYIAKIVRTAKAIDSTGNLLTELEADNSSNELLPGSYTQVHLHVPAGIQSWRLPSNTLLFRSDGIFVAIVNAQQRVQFDAVKIGRDFGGEIEVLSGITEHDQIILNPPDSLLTDAAVRVLANTDPQK